MSPTTSPSQGEQQIASQSIVEAIKRSAEEWRRKLTSLDRRNPTLYFRPLKTGTLRLPDLSSSEMAALVDEGKALDLTVALEWTQDCAKRIQAIRARARENEEERGIQTMFLALGMATWKSADGGRNPKAPIFLLPVTVTEPAKHVHINRGGDLIINRVMLQFWEQEHNHKVAVFDPDEPIDVSVLHALGRVAEAGGELEGFSVSAECYLGNFSFAKMAMVEDLRRNEVLLALNRLIRAIVGDRASQDAIRGSTGSIEREALDEIEPADEKIVLEADEYQRQAIHCLTNFLSDGIVDGPPGTGKSQTIANLIAALVADGKRVLFVAEKRAALDAVQKRLTQAGLDDLVLDLHGAEARRKTVYERLRNRDEKARFLEDKPALKPTQDLKQLRSKLNAYYRAINVPMTGCEMSVREIIWRLSRIHPEANSESIWYDNGLDGKTLRAQNDAKRAVEIVAQDPDLFRRSPGTPWSNADFSDPSAAGQAIQNVAEAKAGLHRLRSTIDPVVRMTSHETVTLNEIGDVCTAIRIVLQAKQVFDDDIATENTPDLNVALEPARKGLISHVSSYLVNSKYRAALCTARAHARHKTADRMTLASSIADCNTLPDGFLSVEFFKLCSPSLSTEVLSPWERLLTLLSDVELASGEPLPIKVAPALARLAELEAAHRSARRIPAIRNAEADLMASGYGLLLDELKRTSIHADNWCGMADSAWLRSYLEKSKTEHPVLGSFSRDSFEKMRTEFQGLDAKQIANARTDVRRSSAETYLVVRNERADQARIFGAEIRKKIKNMPVRKLVEKAGDIMTALCPCWMASPLSVSQLLPGKAIFDVVIFDEASQVLPEDAIASIARGARTIVAGDQKQLPPTNFFASGSADPEDDEEDQDPELLRIPIAGMESILDVMQTYCSPNSLNIHYRSLDESLIRFSNHEFYYDRLVTFPSASDNEGGLSHILVDAPHVDGEELSSPAETRRVADLVIEHIESHPDETLGVIALGIKHARRLEAEIALRRKGRPDLDEFFANDDIDKAFFVKNLERVQGDERDAIILSFGYAKDAVGNLKNKLGPLNYDRGERRLNVAVTRSKRRMIVTSTFTEHDMDPKRFSSQGAKALCRYLAFARTGGRRLDDAGAGDDEVNDFERDVMEALVAKGMRMVPQLGVTKYRIDLAVVHPRQPNRHILAIECDGAPYHSSATARDRDRLRQRHLESRGWRFHRIWSLDWYEDRVGEIERAMAAYADALAAADVPVAATVATPADGTPANGDFGLKRRPAKPRIFSNGSIADYPEGDIQRILDWVASDGTLRSDEEMLVEAVPALGFQRRGHIIDRRLRASIAKWRRSKLR
jgi:very-short-patch-repair endonuclease